jgi:hypothetical protein
MIFVDYTFELKPDGSLLMDKELSVESMQLKNGDKFVVHIRFDGRIIFQKVVEDGSSRTD